MSLTNVQRVAIHVRAAADHPVPSVWLRHGEAPAEAALRAARSGGAGGVQGVTSQVVTLEELGLRVHAIEIGYGPAAALPVLAPPVPALPVLALPDEPPPDDLVDHLAAFEGPEVGPPIRVQRAGAYAVVLDDDRLLLTHQTNTSVWTLPGGGIDFGEHPQDAVRREVHEETGLTLDAVRLLDVGSGHWTGQAPYGRLEDFHAVRVLYAGTVPRGSVPTVLEVAGSTDEAAWVPLARLDDLDIGETVHLALQHLSDTR